MRVQTANTEAVTLGMTPVPPPAAIVGTPAQSAPVKASKALSAVPPTAQLDDDRTIGDDGIANDEASADADPDEFEIEEILDFEDASLEPATDADVSDLIAQIDERPLSVSLLTERLERDVLPRLRATAATTGYLTLGRLAYAVVALQGSDLHLTQVRDVVEGLHLPIVPSRSHLSARSIPLSAMQEAKRRFGDLIQGTPPEELVINRLGYYGLTLREGTRAFLMQAWMGHCLSRAEEGQHAAVVAREVARVGTDVSAWSPQALAAREALILDNLWAVVRIARKYIGRGVPIDDLIQFGTLGLIRAVEKNDPTRNYRFVTYASSWIWQRITRGICDTARLIRLPVHVDEKRASVQGAADALVERTGHVAAPFKVAAVCGISETLVRGLLITSRPISLDRPGRVPYVERHTSPTDAEMMAAIWQDLLEWQVAKALDTLTDRERLVLESRFGLYGEEDQTLEQVGRGFGVTRERIRQIEAKALKRLRHPSRARHLKAFLDLYEGPALRQRTAVPDWQNPDGLNVR